MEFCAEFAVLQGTLISAQRNFGSLNSLIKDDADGIAAIINSTKNVLRRISEENSDEEKENNLRKVNLFLVLNSDLSVRDSLMDDMNCGHVVGCTPVMSMHLLMKLVWGLSFQKYFFETIMFSPLPLSVELLAAATHAVKWLEPKVALQAVEELCQCAYVRALTLPDSQDDSQMARHILFGQFSNLINFFLESDTKSLMNFSSKELHEYAGQAMERLLNLVNFCLASYLARAPDKEPSPVYDFNCSWDNSTHFTKEFENQITIQNFNEKLLSVCKCNLNHVTIDEWLEWVEFMSESDSSKTQQCVLAEKMYFCNECLCALEQPEELVNELRTMLASMARKPRDEEDEIREADFEEIIKNISSPSKSRGKWFKALLRQNGVLNNELSLYCLENNLDLVDCEAVEAMLNLVCSELEHEVDSSQCERIKNLALSAVQHASVDSQIKILENFVSKEVCECTILLTTNFKDKIIKSLNQSIAASQEFDKFLSNCICLCMESPQQVVEHLLPAGLSSASQGRMVVKVLGQLSVICGLPCGSSCNTLLLQSLSSLMVQHQDWSDSQRDHFTKFAAALTKRGILDNSAFNERCLLPALHASLLEKCWSSVLLWLQTLQQFMETVQVDLNNACLIVLMAQIIDVSQWNILTFSLEAVHVREKAVHILKILVEKMDVLSDTHVTWVQSKLLLLSAQVWSYFSKVWNPWTNAELKLCDLSMILMYLAHGRNDHVITTLQKSKYTRLEWVLALIEVVPMMTADEWNVLSENFNLLNPGPLSLFYLLSDALLFIFVAVADTKNKTMVSCVEYIVRNFGAFVKNFVVPIINTESGESAAQVFEKCIQLITQLPETNEESTVLQLSNILSEIISIVVLSGSTYTQQIAGSIAKLRDGEMKQALVLKLSVELKSDSISEKN